MIVFRKVNWLSVGLLVLRKLSVIKFKWYSLFGMWVKKISIANHKLHNSLGWEMTEYPAIYHSKPTRKKTEEFPFFPFFCSFKFKLMTIFRFSHSLFVVYVRLFGCSFSTLCSVSLFIQFHIIPIFKHTATCCLCKCLHKLKTFNINSFIDCPYQRISICTSLCWNLKCLEHKVYLFSFVFVFVWLRYFYFIFFLLFGWRNFSFIINNCRTKKY